MKHAKTQKRKLAAAAYITAVMAVLAVALASTGPAWGFAASGSRTEVTNTVTAGDINIALNEYGLDEEGKRIPFVQGQAVLPGQKVPKIVEISNLANDCWVRIKPELAGDILEEGSLSITDTGWEKHGDYYYLTSPLTAGTSVVFMTDVTFPGTLTSDDSGRPVQVSLTADAVQTANFMPDFESDDPWFGTIIETCVHGEHIRPEANGDDYSVVFKGGAEGLVRVGEDFFDGWQEIMPGDTLSGTAEIRNDYAGLVRILMYTENVSGEERRLADALTLTIRSGDDTIYHGPLSGVMDTVLLGAFPQGEGTTLTYTLEAPPSLNNAYALTEAETKWVFLAEIPDPVTLFTGGSGRTTIHMCASAMLSVMLAVFIKRKAVTRHHV